MFEVARKQDLRRMGMWTAYRTKGNQDQTNVRHSLLHDWLYFKNLQGKTCSRRN